MACQGNALREGLSPRRSRGRTNRDLIGFNFLHCYLALTFCLPEALTWSNAMGFQTPSSLPVHTLAHGISSDVRHTACRRRELFGLPTLCWAAMRAPLRAGDVTRQARASSSLGLSALERSVNHRNAAISGILRRQGGSTWRPLQLRRSHRAANLDVDTIGNSSDLSILAVNVPIEDADELFLGCSEPSLVSVPPAAVSALHKHWGVNLIPIPLLHTCPAEPRRKKTRKCVRPGG
jgi:hypothetical protein